MLYSFQFLNAVNGVLEREGGFVDDPKDPGGRTKYGISQRSYPNLDIRNLRTQEAMDIYHRDWWEKYHMEQYPEEISNKLLDMSVNMGYHQAAKLIQRAINKYYGYYKLAKIDGILGKNSNQAIEEVKYPKVLLHFIREQQIEFYELLIKNNETLKKFRNGWFNRAVAV